MTYAKRAIQSDRRDIFERVADQIIAALELAQADIAAGKPYSMPWVQGAAAGQPVSIAGRAYRGMNWWILKSLADIYPSQVFGTYRAWQSAGAQVRKGEKSTLVLFWKKLRITAKPGEKCDANGMKSILYARGFSVFAAEQVDGFELDAYRAKQEAKLPNVAERLAHADEIAEGYLARENIHLTWNADQACYIPSIDAVRMPARKAFKSTAKLYSTLFHELGHSTGHANRIKRDLAHRFGSEAYAAEELVAELCAAMTCAALHIETSAREDHARYIASWIKAIKTDARAMVTAASHAQRAADMIIGQAPGDEAEPTNGEEIKEDTSTA